MARLVSDLVVLCVNVPDVWSTDCIFVMRAVTNVAVAASGVLQYPPPYPAGKYISRYVARLYAYRFAMIPGGQALTDRVGNEKSKTAYGGVAAAVGALE